MAFGFPAVDSCTPVTSQLVATAAGTFGTAPAFWGRYFTSPTTGGTVEYHHAAENGPLNAAGIRVLPVARQTGRVNLTDVEGAQDGADNAADFLETFGSAYLAAQGGVFLIFLDVEGAPSLSADYYAGWAQAVASQSNAATGGGVTLRPAVYATQADQPTWAALEQATAAGAACAGLWIARYIENGCSQMPAWDDGFITPAGGVPCPILAWQYAGDCGNLDLSQTNPEIDIQGLLLNLLVLPPPPAVGPNAR
jgi:hypothetical protein